MNIMVIKGGTQDDPQQAHVNVPSYKKDPYGWNLFLQTSWLTSSKIYKLQKYLDEGIDASAKLNILDWWKVNSC